MLEYNEVSANRNTATKTSSSFCQPLFLSQHLCASSTTGGKLYTRKLYTKNQPNRPILDPGRTGRVTPGAPKIVGGLRRSAYGSCRAWPGSSGCVGPSLVASIQRRFDRGAYVQGSAYPPPSPRTLRLGTCRNSTQVGLPRRPGPGIRWITGSANGRYLGTVPVSSRPHFPIGFAVGGGGRLDPKNLRFPARKLYCAT